MEASFLDLLYELLIMKQKSAKKGEWVKCKKMLIMRMWCSRQSCNLMIQVNA
jgi:hypothetical protein